MKRKKSKLEFISAEFHAYWGLPLNPALLMTEAYFVSYFWNSRKYIGANHYQKLSSFDSQEPV